MTERLLMVDVCAPGGEIEAEPVTVRTSPGALELTLDDGTVLTFDRMEFLAVAVDVSVREAA